MAILTVLFKYDGSIAAKHRKYPRRRDRDGLSLRRTFKGGYSIMSVWLIVAAAAASPACPIDRALYAQPGNPGPVAGFAKQRVKSRFSSDLVFFVREGKQVFWFGFDMPNGYGGPYITPQRDPKLVKEVPEDGEESPEDSVIPPKPRPANKEKAEPDSDGAMNIDFFDAKLHNLESVPQVGNHPPAYIFSAALGPFFHYLHNSELYPPGESLGITRETWRVVGCEAKGR
jgi:hypothetical protein